MHAWGPRRSRLATLIGTICGLGCAAETSERVPRNSRLSRRVSAVSASAMMRPPDTVRILMTGDVMLGRGVDQVLPHHCTPRIYEQCVQDARDYVALAVERNGPLPAERGPAYPWGVALQDMAARRPDVRLINLETAVTSHHQPWPHKGINYRMHPGNIGTLTAAGIQVASLANNHVLDWCEEGLLETLGTLRGAGVQAVGAGRDAEEAQRPAIVRLPAATKAARGKASGGEPSDGAPGEEGGGRVLVWAVGHDSSGVPDEWEAGEGRPGVFVTDLSPRDVARLGAAVRAEKREGRDVAVLSVHWGSNWGYDVPKAQQRFARALIDQAGVDIVHGHSSHHAKGCEVYCGKLILYGAGDLISDYEGIRNPGIEAYYPPDWYRDDVGALWYADVALRDGKLRQLSMVPTRLRHLRLEPPEPQDWRYIERTLDRECRKLGAEGVQVSPEGDALLLQLPSSTVEE